MKTSQCRRTSDESSDEDLAALALSGNKDAESMLVERYRALAYAKSLEYASFPIETDDLAQEGMIGLYKAIRSFDAARSIAFHPFAELCIARQLISAVRAATKHKLRRSQRNKDLRRLALLLKDSEHWSNILTDFERETLKMLLYGKTPEAVAKELNCSVESINNAVMDVKRKVSFALED